MLHLQKVVDTDEEEQQNLQDETINKSFTYQGNIPISERKRLYEAPDYALVTTKSGIKTLEKDLTSLVEKGGFYYEVFEM